MPAPRNDPKSDNGDANDIGEVTDVVQKLIDMMGKGNIRSMELTYGELEVSLKAHPSGAPAQAPVYYTSQPTSYVEHQLPAAEEPEAGHVVTAPMIGTFYVAPAPNEAPFVQPGDEVTEGQTIGIIEAMKIMNEIATDRGGVVIEVVAIDGQTVEYGSPLVRIESATE